MSAPGYPPPKNPPDGFYQPTLGSTPPGGSYTQAVTATYPPSVGNNPTASAGYMGAALAYTQKELGGETSESESDTTVAQVAIQVAIGSPDRVGLVMTNNGNNDVWIGLTPNVAANQGIKLTQSGGTVGMNVKEDFTLPSRQWWAISSVGNNSVHTVEEVRILKF